MSRDINPSPQPAGLDVRMANVRRRQTPGDPLRIAPKPPMLEDGGQIVYVCNMVDVASFHNTTGLSCH